MTVDRNTRKQAKKNWKTHAKRAEELGPKRERKKKSKARRLCKGMCYNTTPLITAEDRVWRDASDDEENQV